jgi:soluble lytic murein transglycosylase-like protein
MEEKSTNTLIHMAHRMLLVIFNVCLVYAGLYIVDGDKTVPATIKEISETPREAALPFRRLTREEKARQFLEELQVDNSHIRPRTIRTSLEPWQPYIRRYSSLYNVDPYLVSAILYAESKGDPYRISRDGAQGLMQIMPATASFLGFDNVLDPENNIMAGVKYISWLVNRYGETHALWAWNAGPSRVHRKHLPTETRRFIVEVISVKKYLEEGAFEDGVS